MRQFFNGMEKQSYAVQKHGWQARGRFFCRYGVFFMYQKACPCLTFGSHDLSVWADAEKMPYLDEDHDPLQPRPIRKTRRSASENLASRLVTCSKLRAFLH